MPIVVKCEHCSARFQVRDVYAGKRGKCLRCRQSVVVPMGDGPAGTVRIPPDGFPPPTAAPVVSKPQEPEPTPVPLRPAVEFDWPKTPVRRPEPTVDDDEDALAGKPWRVGDEPAGEPWRGGAGPKKASALPRVLRLLAALVVLGGGGAVVWLVVNTPKQAKVTPTSAAVPSTEQQPPPTTEEEAHPPTGGPTATALAKLRGGMTHAEVEAILGKGQRAASEIDVAAAVSAVPDGEDAADRWNGKMKLGHVWVWNKGFDAIGVAYSADPDAGGRVVGLVGTFGRSGSEPLKLPDPATPNPNAKPVDPKTLPGYPEATLTAAELARDHAKYKDKWVVVTGKLKRDVPPLADGDVPTGAGIALEHIGLPIGFAGAGVGRAGAKEGTEVEIWGKVDGLNADATVVAMSDCLVQKPATEVEATAVMAEYLKDGPAAAKKYEGQPLKVSGTVTEAVWKVMVGSKTGDKSVRVYCDALNDKALNLRPGDQVVVLTNNLKFFTDEKQGWKSCTLWEGRVISLKR